MLLSAMKYGHQLLKETIRPGETVIDATVGKGKDTVFLATLVGSSGSVIGFDIQKEAIDSTRDKLLLTGLHTQTTLHHMGHEQVGTVLSEKEKIGAALFNLGYLPTGDKTITTTCDTTLVSIQALLPHLRKGGIIVLVVYPGHPEGKREAQALLEWIPTLSQADFDVLHYSFLNQKNAPPFLLAIEKK